MERDLGDWGGGGGGGRPGVRGGYAGGYAGGTPGVRRGWGEFTLTKQACGFLFKSTYKRH